MGISLFHYTTVARAALIMRDNLLQISPPPTPSYLWVSSNPVMERTSVAYWPAGRSGTPDLYPALHRPVRFAIPDEEAAAAVPWKSAKMTYTLRRKLEAVGRQRGAFPREWFAVLHPISADRCRLEVQTDGTWSAADWPEIAATFAGLDVEIIDGQLAIGIA